jgi:alpha-1,4-digalacturonate transport system substrate-binding protein
MLRLGFAAALVAAAIASAPAARAAVQLRITCYSDGNECPVTKELAARFTQANPDIQIEVDEVPYSAILQSLPVQLASGNGPDIARVTLFGTFTRYMLDLRPYLKDADAWEANYGPELEWMRSSPDDHGIYGLMTQLTITAPFVDKTLFDQANVPLPGPKATWDDWVAAVDKVAKATNTPFGMAWDRSGHRFSGPAISYGAKYFGPDGKPAVVDDGFKAIASRWVKWNQDGSVDKSVWAAQASGYGDAFADFQNGKIVLYLSGSWQLNRMAKQIGDAFDWVVVPNPCGPAACTGMPGGAALVAFKQTQHPQEVARFLDWLSQPAIYAEYMQKTSNIPASLAVRKAGVTYNLPPAGKAAMQALLQNANDLAPLAYQLQGYRYNATIFNATADRLGQAIAGSMTLDQAYQRITEDIDKALAAAAK